MVHQRRRLECPCNIGFTPFQYEISIIIIIIVVVCFIVIIISNNFVIIIIIIIIIVSSSSSAGSQAAEFPKNKYFQILILILLSLYNMFSPCPIFYCFYNSYLVKLKGLKTDDDMTRV